MSSNPPVKKPIEILFSYAREDEALRDKLEKHLSTLKRQNRIICWYDRNIRAGTTWNKAVSTHLDIIPVILRKCDWHNEKFAQLQALPRDARPVVSWPNQDDALYDVAVGIKKVVEELEKM